MKAKQLQKKDQFAVFSGSIQIESKSLKVKVFLSLNMFIDSHCETSNTDHLWILNCW